ncbi:uncharacterized protein LOC125217824 isoform X2 [Salvia hispanica]|uniref:uncharacterized protein LOC125217824 isoform X2 n=1 Tax=Salvia hispanica TaxID=49212 RepID=UPI002008FE75|nr:uncharacterized protein LOC125217824 isoform X2 [Salvia hispanica]
MEEIKRIEVGPPPASSSYYDDRSTQGINPTAASEQNFNRDGLSAVRGPRVSAPRRIFVFFGNTMADATKRSLLSTALGRLSALDRKIMADTAVIVHKNAEGGHIGQENGGLSEVRKISQDCIAKYLELTSENEYLTRFKEWISDYELDATRVRKLNKCLSGRLQAAYEHFRIALKALFRGNTASDKQTCSFSLAGWLHRLCPELDTNDLSQAVIQLTELLSVSTKFFCRIKEGVACPLGSSRRMPSCWCCFFLLQWFPQWTLTIQLV